MKFICLLLLLFCIQCFSEEQKTLTILSWENFFPKEVISDFEKRHNIRIRVISYYTDEMKDFIFKDNTYHSIDIVISSTNGIMDYAQNKKIITIENKKLKNLKNMNRSYSTYFTETHSISISYGALGIVYRNDLIEKPPLSFKDLIESKNNYSKKMFLIPSPEDMMDIFLLAENTFLDSYDINSLYSAASKLNNMFPHLIDYKYPEQRALQILSSGQAYIGVAYGFEIYKSINKYKNIGFYYPKEGAKAWTDNIAISTSSKDQDLSYKFLDFVMEPKIASLISNHNSYATFNKEALKYIPENIKNNQLIYPHLNGINLVVDKMTDNYIIGKKFFFYHKITGKK